MDRTTFQAWLDGYIAAWRSGDAGDIGALFSPEADYYYGPDRDPVHGRDAIVAQWTANPDAPGSWEAEYRPVAIDGDVAVASGESRYPAEARTYSNVFVCRFDADGRCREFREWFMEHPRNAKS